MARTTKRECRRSLDGSTGMPDLPRDRPHLYLRKNGRPEPYTSKTPPPRSPLPQRLAPRVRKRGALLHALQCSSTRHRQSRTTRSSSRLQVELRRSFTGHSDSIPVWYNSPANWAREKVRADSFAIPPQTHATTKSRTDCSRLPAGVDEFPYSREMMIVSGRQREGAPGVQGNL